MKVLRLFAVCCCLINTNSFAATASSGTSSAAGTSSAGTTSVSGTSFIPSEFQQSAGQSIENIETAISNFLKNKEIIDLNYGLHLVNYINQNEENVLPNAEQQFVKDFARMACYSTYEGNLPECNNANTKDSLKTYGFLRPSNIFDIYREDPQEDALASFAVKTMIDPLPSNKLNELLSGEDINKPEVQQKIANLIAAQAPITLAKNSLNEIIAKRAKLNEESSMIKIMKDESSRRLKSDWMENIKDSPTNHLLLELLQIEAFKLWVDYHKFLQTERLEALVATLLASQNTTMQQMIEKYNDAIAVGQKNTAEYSTPK